MPDDETILVADDSADQRQALLDILDAKGYRAKGVGRGADAMAELHMGGIGLLLLDLRLPGMDGLEVLRNIRSAQIDSQVIVITGNATLENAIQALNLGAFAYCTKPLDIDNLLHTISQALEQRSLRRQLAQKEREVKAHAEFHLKILNERVQLIEEARRREESLSRLVRMIALASHYQSPLDMAQTLLRLIQQETKAEYASLTLVNKDGTLGKRADSFQGMDPFDVQRRPGGLIEMTLKTSSSQYVADVQADPRANPALVNAGIRSCLAVPLAVDKRTAGVLFLHSLHPDAFQDDQQLLEACGPILATNLLRSELIASLEKRKLDSEAILDAIGDAIAVVDEERRILRANKAFANLVGASQFAEHLIGQKVCQLVHGFEQPAPGCPLGRAMEQAGPGAALGECPALGDKRLESRLFQVPASAGGPRRFVHVIRTL